MTLLHALTLGILQGVTEFLPVSSSGHLVLAELVFDMHIDPKNMQSMNIMLHAGTVLALLILYFHTWAQLLMAPFRKDRSKTSMLVLLVLATIPAGVVGILFEDVVAVHFQSLLSIGLAFLMTGLILLLGECGKQRASQKNMTVRSALIIGCVQALALVPGLSRSGLTISAGRMMGLGRKEALDFSFLMVVPVIGGATLLTLKDVVRGVVELPSVQLTTVAISASFVSSLLSIVFLRHYVVHRGLGIFAPYLIIVSVLTIFLSVLQ